MTPQNSDLAGFRDASRGLGFRGLGFREVTASKSRRKRIPSNIGALKNTHTILGGSLL